MAFWLYWLRNLEIASKGHKMVLLIAAILMVVLNLFGWLPSTNIPRWITLTVDIAMAVYCLLWIPFARHNEQERKHSIELSDLEKRTNQLEVERLSETAKGQIEESQRKANKQRRDALGMRLMMIQSRLQFIESMSALRYGKELEGEYLWDKETIELIDRVTKQVQEMCGTSEAAIFVSTPKPDAPEVDRHHPFRTLEIPRRATISHLKAYIASLTKIVERMP